jgi:hypothetical protein
MPLDRQTCKYHKGKVMKYSIECFDQGRVQPAIALRVQDDAWDPHDGQVEIPNVEAGRHASLDGLKHWGVVVFEHDRMGVSYHYLETMLSQ